MSQLRDSWIIDGCQYCNWSEQIFRQMRDGNVGGVIVTVAYHETFRETVDKLVDWNWRLQEFADLIVGGRSVADIHRAAASGRTALFFGLQTSSPIETDLGLVEILHTLGIRFMQLSYNNQSLLCGGWTEEDSGVTQMGREVIREMNRLGMVIDMSHSGERSTLDAIELSEKPIVVSHANPSSWRATDRNKSDKVLQALAAHDGLVGLSAYPAHLGHGSETTVEQFATMVARLAELIGVQHIGLGTDLCQDQPDSVVAWMREGRWRYPRKSSEPVPHWPAQPAWFRSNLDFHQMRQGLASVGFSQEETNLILGGNWLRFLTRWLPAHEQQSNGHAGSGLHVPAALEPLSSSSRRS
jgi:membrane dipeptidase